MNQRRRLSALSETMECRLVLSPAVLLPVDTGDTPDVSDSSEESVTVRSRPSGRGNTLGDAVQRSAPVESESRVAVQNSGRAVDNSASEPVGSVESVPSASRVPNSDQVPDSAPVVSTVSQTDDVDSQVSAETSGDQKQQVPESRTEQKIEQKIDASDTITKSLPVDESRQQETAEGGTQPTQKSESVDGAAPRTEPAVIEEKKTRISDERDADVTAAPVKDSSDATVITERNDPAREPDVRVAADVDVLRVKADEPSSKSDVRPSVESQPRSKPNLTVRALDSRENTAVRRLESDEADQRPDEDNVDVLSVETPAIEATSGTETERADAESSEESEASDDVAAETTEVSADLDTPLTSDVFEDQSSDARIIRDPRVTVEVDAHETMTATATNSSTQPPSAPAPAGDFDSVNWSGWLGEFPDATPFRLASHAMDTAASQSLFSDATHVGLLLAAINQLSSGTSSRFALADVLEESREDGSFYSRQRRRHRISGNRRAPTPLEQLRQSFSLPDTVEEKQAITCQTASCDDVFADSATMAVLYHDGDSHIHVSSGHGWLFGGLAAGAAGVATKRATRSARSRRNTARPKPATPRYSGDTVRLDETA